MKLLADENFPRLAVEAARAAGHDVTWISEDDSSIADRAVLAVAVAEGRVILTLDKDFGELLFAAAAAPPPGVLFLRPGDLPPGEVARRLLGVLSQSLPLVGRFTVHDGKRLRSRPLPAPPR